MSRQTRYDALVVGTGPNGLAAAITLAQAGRAVVVYEASEAIGGGSRTQELTLPGFRHDVCSAIHPLGVASPFFRSLPLDRYGLEWVYPPAPLAHPLADGAVVLEHSLGAMEASLGKRDASAWRGLFTPFVEEWNGLAQGILGPLRPGFQFTHPLISLQMARFGVNALQPARMLAERTFHGERARALFGGMAAHSMLPLERPVSAAIALVLGTLGHLIGWPFPKGGSQAFVEALAAYLRSLGGEIVTGVEVTSLHELPTFTRRSLRRDAAPDAAHRRRRAAGAGIVSGSGDYRYGPGVFKIDYALDGPIPWKDAACAARGHGASGRDAGGDRLRRAERVAGRRAGATIRAAGAAEPLRSHARASRASTPPGPTATFPTAATLDMTARIEAQIERFAPGFRDRILARHTLTSGADGALQRRTTSAATSTAAYRISASSSPAPSRASIPTRRRTSGSTSARHRRRRAAASTACAATTRRAPPCVEFSPDLLANKFAPAGVPPQNLPAQVSHARRCLASTQVDVVAAGPQARFQPLAL